MSRQGIGLAVLLIATCAALAEDAADSDISDNILSPSSAGEVSFPHRFHFDDVEISCAECHHETAAAELDFPHEDYLADLWIDCHICHKGAQTGSMPSQKCSLCHHASPVTVADETASAKVVIHQLCWSCHELGKGAEASRGCADCHTGPQASP